MSSIPVFGGVGLWVLVIVKPSTLVSYPSISVTSSTVYSISSPFSFRGISPITYVQSLSAVNVTTPIDSPLANTSTSIDSGRIPSLSFSSSQTLVISILVNSISWWLVIVVINPSVTFDTNV